MSLIILIIWFVIAAINLSYPAFSIQELKNIPDILFTFITPNNLWYLRIIPLVTVGLYIYVLHNRYSKKKILSVVLLLTTPWLFVVAREFNILNVIFFISIIMLHLNKRRLYYLSIGLLFISLFFLKPHFDIDFFTNKIKNLQYTLDISFLFFQMEKQPYFLVPHTGYFSVIVIPFLIMGIIHLQHQRTLVSLIILSIVFYFLSPDQYFIMCGIGFLSVVTIFMVNGVEQVTNSFVKIIIVGLAILFFVYFLDLYFNHYQRKIGNARNHAEIQLVNYVRNHSRPKYIMADNILVIEIVKQYTRNENKLKISFVKSNNFKKSYFQCANTEKIQCILTKEEYYLLPKSLQKKVQKIDDLYAGVLYYLL